MKSYKYLVLQFIGTFEISRSFWKINMAAPLREKEPIPLVKLKVYSI